MNEGDKSLIFNWYLYFDQVLKGHNDKIRPMLEKKVEDHFGKGTHYLQYVNELLR
ncbi:hypothetical protein LC040_10420 [Bacillus tianshenii]|nr:hypothetical protein LC040_10420 [Bacillus tianshenii]